MKTPPLKPLIIASLPVFASVFIAATLVWHFNTPKLVMPFVLGIIAGGLVDLDNRLTGRLKNIVITVALFTLSSLLAQSTIGTGVPFILAMTLMTFGFTILGTVGLKYRTFAFGALAVATYTTLTYTPETYWLTNPVMILLGTVLYSVNTLIFQIILPHRPVQETVANAYDALSNYFDAKADFFDPDEAAWLGNRQIDLAMSNTGVITAFNQCRGALFYRLRGQHRHPRTAKMLRYYLCAQDMHERISSAHVDYSEMAEQLKNTDLIFRIRRLLEMQGQACRNVAPPCATTNPTHTANASAAPWKAAANPSAILPRPMPIMPTSTISAACSTTSAASITNCGNCKTMRPLPKTTTPTPASPPLKTPNSAISARPSSASSISTPASSAMPPASPSSWPRPASLSKSFISISATGFC